MQRSLTGQQPEMAIGKPATQAGITTIQEQIEQQHILLCKIKEGLTAVHAKLFGAVPSDEPDEAAPGPDKIPIQTQLKYNSILLTEIRSILEELTERL